MSTSRPPSQCVRVASPFSALPEPCKTAGGAGGGYVLNSVHNIQPDVPPEDVVALFAAAEGA